MWASSHLPNMGSGVLQFLSLNEDDLGGYRVCLGKFIYLFFALSCKCNANLKFKISNVMHIFINKLI
jgi:hypothetical protein